MWSLPRTPNWIRCGTLGVVLAAALLPLAGCSMIARIGNDPRGEALGKTFYLGGAGPFGHIGTTSVPAGLRQGGWRGAIEVVGWQSNLGGTLRDQMDVWRNRAQAAQLTDRIIAYLARYPGRPVNIIALSAGTGIAAWGIADLPAGYEVRHFVMLSSSLSATHDVQPVLARLTGNVWNIYAPNDPVLRLGVPITGTVDRTFTMTDLAGLNGLRPPLEAPTSVDALYEERIRNLQWRSRYGELGFHGRHVDAVAEDFIARVVTPIIRRPPPRRAPAPDELPVEEPLSLQPASQPAAPARPAPADPVP